MKVLYGANIPKHLYGKIADFDSEIFPADSDEFNHDTAVPREQILSMLEKNIQTTVIMIDDHENIMAYFQSFPIYPEYEEKFLRDELDFTDVDGDKIMPPDSENINLYIMSAGIKKEYRGIKIPRPNEENVNSPIVLLLYEGLVDSIIELYEKGVSIENVFGNAVSPKGVRMMEGLCGKDGLISGNDAECYYSFHAKFSPDCTAFAKCTNLERLQEVCKQPDSVSPF